MTVAFDHSLYINAVLCWFSMDDCNTACTLLDPGMVLSANDGPQIDEERTKMWTMPYHELISTLTWIVVVSQPDISFATTYLMHFNMNPGQMHQKAAMHVLHYLRGTVDYQLTMGCHLDDPSELTTYVDSNWGCDIDTCHPVSRYIFLFGNSAISWSVKQQTTVAASSTEAEYMSISHTACQGL